MTNDYTGDSIFRKVPEPYTVELFDELKMYE